MEENRANAKFTFKIWEFFSAEISLPFKFGKTKPDFSLIPAQRFLRLFNDHGITNSQIPRFIPEITLDKSRDCSTLIPALTDEVMEKASQLFKVRREWLEGVGNKIYDCYWWYQNPSRFFEDLKMISEQPLFPIIAFCNGRAINKNSNIVLVLAEVISHIGENEICRYYICEDEWSWDYYKSRIQLKTMARIAHNLLRVTIPIYSVDSKIMGEIRSGFRIPSPYLSRKFEFKDVRLEDFALSPEESIKSKESDELSNVKEFILKCDLQKYQHRVS